MVEDRGSKHIKAVLPNFSLWHTNAAPGEDVQKPRVLGLPSPVHYYCVIRGSGTTAAVLVLGVPGAGPGPRWGYVWRCGASKSHPKSVAENGKNITNTKTRQYVWAKTIQIMLASSLLCGQGG